MNAVRMIVVVVAVAFVIGCGQKYPATYGLYLKEGSSWVAVAGLDKAYTIPASPQFLLFDARLTQAPGKPDASITLSPLKWRRFGITALTVSSDADPHLYSKMKTGGFVEYGQRVTMAYAPVKNEPNMLMVSPTTPLPDGYFVLNVFGDQVICRYNVTDDPEKLPDAHKVDIWTKTYDEAKGFSWDAFLAQSMNRGRAVFEEGTKPTSAFTSLIENLRQQLSALVAAKSSPPLIAFCKLIEHLDADMFADARRQCLDVIETEMATARSNHDPALAVGVGVLATNAGFTGDALIKQLETARRDLITLEESIAKKAALLEADIGNEGQPILTVAAVRKSWVSTTVFTNYLTDARLFCSVDGQFKHPMTSATLSKPSNHFWMGYLRYMISRGVKEPQLKLLLSSCGGSVLFFDNTEDRDRFATAAMDAQTKWRQKHEEQLVVQVNARPHCWSEKIYCGGLPYAIECAAGSNGVAIADVAVDAPVSGGAELYIRDGRFRGAGGGTQFGTQFRVRSLGPDSVTIRVLYCPLPTSKEIEGFGS